MKAILAMTTALWGLSPAVRAQTLYDIKFDTPDQGVNQVVVARATESDHVSQIIFGAPEVVSSFGGLTDQPLRFDTVNMPAGHVYDQIELGVWGASLRTLDLSFDFTSSGLIGTLNNFTVLFDTPNVRNLYFRHDGQIAIDHRDVYWTARPIGTFADGETFHVRIHLDFGLGLWSTYKDGVQLDESPFFPEEFVQGIRLSYGADSGLFQPDTSAVAIDNILVEVPEPGCLSLLGVGTLWLMPKFRTWKTAGGGLVA